MYRNLETIPVSGRLWRQMVRAGRVAGVCGTPWYWTPGGVLERVFCESEPAAVKSLESGLKVTHKNTQRSRLEMVAE